MILPHYKAQVFSILADYFPEQLAEAVYKTDAELMSLYSDMLDMEYL